MRGFHPMNNKMPPTRNRGGAFTLIELLTVIAIIGILAAILIPVVGAVRDKARVSVCLSNLRQLGGAVHLYALDHADRTPPQRNPNTGSYDFNVGVYTGGSGDLRTIGWLMSSEVGGRSPYDYLDTVEVAFCPGLDEVYAGYPAYKRPETISKSNPTDRIGYVWIYYPDVGSYSRRANDRVGEYPNRAYLFDFGWSAGWFPAPLDLPSHSSSMNVLHVGGHVSSIKLDDANRFSSLNLLYDFMSRERN